MNMKVWNHLPFNEEEQNANGLNALSWKVYA